MKRLLTSIAIALLAAPAFAVLTLPIAEEATTQQGEMRITGAVTLESDVSLYGGRFSYGIMDGLSVFAGAGLYDPDRGDSEPYFQIGSKYTLPVDAPVDLALRGAFGLVSFDESWSGAGESQKFTIDYWMLNVGVLASMPIDTMITVYGFGGISYQNIKVKGTYTETWMGETYRESFSDSDSETELAIAGGGIFNLNPNISLGAELAHIDELFISLYGRFKF